MCHATSKQRASPRGVTLLEALATLVLIAVVIPATMHGVTVSLRAAQQARLQQEASALAEWRLNEIVALRDPALYSGVGDFAPHFPEYRWQIENAPADFAMTEVWITVSWQVRGQERSLSLSTLVYPPNEDSSDTFGSQ